MSDLLIIQIQSSLKKKKKPEFKSTLLGWKIGDNLKVHW